MQGFTRIPAAFLIMACVCFLLHFGIATAQTVENPVPPIHIFGSQCIQVGPGSGNSLCAECKQRSDEGSGWCFSYLCDPGGTVMFKTCVYSIGGTCKERSDVIFVDPCANCLRWTCSEELDNWCLGCPCAGDNPFEMEESAHWKTCD